MTLRFTRRALADAKRMKTWWRRNRDKAPDLFERELDVALDAISATPTAAAVYEEPSLEVEVRRTLMPKSQNHVYYSVIGDEVTVLAIWGHERAGARSYKLPLRIAPQGARFTTNMWYASCGAWCGESLSPKSMLFW